MSLQDVLNRTQTLLNRSDCSQDLALNFISEGFSRITRDVRIPSLEKLQVITPTAPLLAIDLPENYISTIDLFVMTADPGCWTNPILDGEVVPQFTFLPLIHRSYRQLLRVSSMDVPSSYARFQAQMQIRGAVPTGVELQHSYYAEPATITDLTQDNELTASSPDLCIYAALSFAGDYFAHPSTTMWEQRYQSILASIQLLASDLEMQGGPLTMQPVYAEY